MSDQNDATATSTDGAASTTTARRGVRLRTSDKKDAPASGGTQVTFAPAGGTNPNLPPSVARTEAVQQYQKERQQFQEIISGFDFGENSHSVIIHRLEPMFFKGKKVGGYITEMRVRPDLEEIKQKYGGGKFKFTVMGPGVGGPTRQFRTSTIVDIMGNPIPEDDGSGQQEQKPQGGISTEVVGLLHEFLHKGDRQSERLEQEVRETRNQLLTVATRGESSVVDALTRVMNPGQQQQLLIEERRLAEERMRHEREDRRLAQEAAEKRWQAESAAAERRHEALMASIKAEAERKEREWKDELLRREKAEKEQREHEREAAKERIERERQDHEFRMKALEKEQDREAQRSKDNLTFMMAQVRETSEMKDAIFEKLMKKDDGLDGLLKTKQLLDMLSGKDDDDDDRPTWERVMDKVGDMAPSVLGALGLGAAAIGGVRREKKGNEDTEREERRRRRRQRRLQPGTEVRVDNPPEQPKVEGEEAKALPEPDKNDLKAITLPTEEQANPTDVAGINALVELLVKNVDWAMEHEYMPFGIYENVIKKFPETVSQYIRGQTEDQLVAVIKENAPGTWRINSIDGHKKLRELHRLIMKGD